MSTNWIWNIDSEKDRKNEKEGDRLAELNEKKSARELGWETKNKGDEFRWKNSRGEKMKNASRQGGGNEQQ